MSWALYPGKYRFLSRGGIGMIYQFQPSANLRDFLKRSGDWVVKCHAYGLPSEFAPLVVKRVFFRQEFHGMNPSSQVEVIFPHILDPGFVAEIVLAQVRLPEALVPHLALAWPSSIASSKGTMFSHAEVLMPRCQSVKSGYTTFTRFALEITKALVSLHHAGLIHGDIKLSNVMSLGEARFIDRNTMHPFVPWEVGSHYDYHIPYLEFNKGTWQAPELYLQSLLSGEKVDYDHFPDVLLSSRKIPSSQVGFDFETPPSDLYLMLKQKLRTSQPDSYYGQALLGKRLGLQPEERPKALTETTPLLSGHMKHLEGRAVDWYALGFSLLLFFPPAHPEVFRENPLKALVSYPVSGFWKDFIRACLLPNPKERMEVVELYLASLQLPYSLPLPRGKGVPAEGEALEKVTQKLARCTLAEKLVLLLFLEDWLSMPRSVLDDLPWCKMLQQAYWYLHERCWSWIGNGYQTEWCLKGSQLARRKPKLLFLLARALDPRDECYFVICGLFQTIAKPVNISPAQIHLLAQEAADEMSRLAQTPKIHVPEPILDYFLPNFKQAPETSGLPPQVHEVHDELFQKLFNISTRG